MDYEKIGLKAGLEIHQQLDGKKLFCSCPNIIRDDAPDFTIRRTLRASAGETGEIDVAAQSEMDKKKYFIYEAYNDTSCEVELDECPPQPLNSEALNVTLQFSIMTEAKIVDQVHVMRKTVVDGSNTSGFQRTALIARNGAMDVELKSGEHLKIKIDTICLEEDAARIIKRDSDFDVYRLDRLGIPLIEIATGPDMHTPQQVKEVAGYIGMLLRSTGKVKRGLGTIRQDVNISVAGGERAEIKGVQDLRMIDKVVELEALRQSNMINLRDEIISKGIKLLPSKNIDEFTSEFSSSQSLSAFLKKGIDSGLKVYGKAYPSFKGILGYEVNPGRRFGTELSDRIKTLGLNGLIHTDENLEKYGLQDVVLHIYHTLGLAESDGIIFILGSEEKCKLAFRKIDETLSYFIKNGLSKEVRNAKDDGTSTFLRPMPGSSRMYPETDVPTIIPDIFGIEKPELIKDKTERLAHEYNLPKQVARELVFEPDFENFVKKYLQVKPITIADSLTRLPKELETRYKLVYDFDGDFWDTLFREINSGNIDPSGIIEIMRDKASGEGIDFSKYKTSEDEIVSFIAKTISEKPELNSNAIMGLVMKEYRGKFSGQKILELIKKFKE